MNTILSTFALSIITLMACAPSDPHHPPTTEQGEATPIVAESSPKESSIVGQQIVDTVLGGHDMRVYFDTSYHACINEGTRSAALADGRCFVPLVIQVDGLRTGFGICTEVDVASRPLGYMPQNGQYANGVMLQLKDSNTFAFAVHYQTGYQGLCMFRLVGTQVKLIPRCDPLPFNEYVYFSETKGFAYHAGKDVFFAAYDRFDDVGSFEILRVKKDCFGFWKKKKAARKFDSDAEIDEAAYLEFGKSL